MIMKKSDLKLEIKKYITEILSEEEVNEVTMVGKDTQSSKIPAIAKTEKTSPSTVQAAIDQAKKTNTPVGVAENNSDKTSVLKKLRGK